MSAPAIRTIQLAMANRWSKIQAPNPPMMSETIVLMIWSAPQAADVHSSRAVGAVLRNTPSRQDVPRAIHRRNSEGLGSAPRTGGGKGAAAIPVEGRESGG